jgi:5-dehydro-4-deoxyglucarate dehydratase
VNPLFLRSPVRALRYHTMSPDTLGSKLVGVIAFPVTPFRADRSLDLDGLRRNLRSLMAHPIAAVVAAGGTGELYSLAPDEYDQVIRATIEEVAGRVPVIAGVGFNTAIAVRLARNAASAGASGLLAFPPYYPGADDDGVLEYYRAIGDASSLAMLIYSRDWFHPGPDLVERLARIPSLIAWKDGQGDIRRLQQLQARVGNRLRWIGGAGDDMVPAYYAIGIRAFTSSVANIAPDVALRLHAAGSSGDISTLHDLITDLIVPLYALRARRRGYEVTVMKELMNLVGLDGGVVRPPLPHLRSSELEELRALAPRWQSLLQTAAP